MIDRMRAAAEHINQMQGKIKTAARSLRSANPSFTEFIEQSMALPVVPSAVEGNICAVDGGLLAQEMYGIDLLLGRAVGVNFQYDGSVLGEVSYSPGAFPESSYEVQIGLDEHEIIFYRSLFRLNLEIECAISCVEKYSPSMLFLDGSIVPLAADKPAQESQTFSKYSELISNYLKLYELCSSCGTTLLGITKDSRGKRFTDIVKDSVPSRWPDTIFLNYFLEEKERTSAMKYSSSPEKHAVLRDLGPYADKVCLFYLKCFDEDQPMRVEFLASNRSISELSSVVYSLSAINKNYAYPAVLIEADLRAAMDPFELERAQHSLMALSGFAKPLKRNSRPFR